MTKNKEPIFITLIYFTVSLLYVLFRYALLKQIPIEGYTVVLLNKALAFTAVFLLFRIAFDKVYQIKSKESGTEKKYYFKFYGTTSTAIMFVHAFLSVIVFDEVHLPKFFTNGYLNETGDMTLLWGISALSIFMAIAIIGVTAKNYNSKRRNVPFLISLGYLFLLLHVFTLGEKSWFTVENYLHYGLPVSLLSFILIISGAYFNIKVSREKRRRLPKEN